MAEITADVTRKMAMLARLELSAEEVELYTSQLGQVLGHIRQLQEVDVDGVEPLTSPLEVELRLDADVAAPTNPDVLEHAPETEGGGFRVPRIL
jgi:aspartyl-tRNA(Asn)/glutamyl-tRNA(Gln) amidotransferase subunit C